MATIALTMIVGKGDAAVLRRCLSSVPVQSLFEQIIIVLTSDDEEVRAVAEEYATDIVPHAWHSERYPHGDFSGARNAALPAVMCDYWMWLDADDVLPKEDIVAIGKLKSLADAHRFDIGCAPYILAEDKENGKPIQTIYRERFVRTESGIRWRYPVHEQLTVDWKEHKRADLNGFVVIHRPDKVGFKGANRNLLILEHEYHCAPYGKTRHTLFYYARDHYSAGSHETAIPLLMDVLRDFYNSPDGDRTLLYETLEILAHYYTYNDSETGICQRTVSIGEGFARASLALTDHHAEPLVFIGDALISRDKPRVAEHYYRKATEKKFGEGGLQAAAYYGYIPFSRLTGIYKARGEKEMALLCNRRVLGIAPDDKAAVSDRKDLVCSLLREVI